ncbi:MAG: phage holin [Clostridia bacterium]|nr:phage holin [Clostridia bacterium]
MNISKMTIIRTFALIIALINQLLTVLGANPLPFSDEELYEGISILVTVGTSLWSWWKNNSFTKEAIEADGYMHKLKGAK